MVKLLWSTSLQYTFSKTQPSELFLFDNILRLCPKYRKRDDSSYDNQMYRNTLSEREACDNVSMTSMGKKIWCICFDSLTKRLCVSKQYSKLLQERDCVLEFLLLWRKTKDKWNYQVFGFNSRCEYVCFAECIYKVYNFITMDFCVSCNCLGKILTKYYC